MNSPSPAWTPPPAASWRRRASPNRPPPWNQAVANCRLHRADGALLEQYITIGEVVEIHLDRAYLEDGMFHLLATHPVQRAGYQDDYTEATAGFQMKRP